LSVATLLAIATIAGTTLAQKATAPKPQDKLVLAESQVTQLLLLMDTGKNGKVSKQEWLKFMEAEFDRLDKGKKGELSVRDLTPQLRASRFAEAGK